MERCPRKGWTPVKKLIALCLMVALLGFGMVGCGGGGGGSGGPKPTGTTAPK